METWSTAAIFAADLSIQAVHCNNRCFCFQRSVGNLLTVFSAFSYRINANIDEIQKLKKNQLDLNRMLLLESVDTLKIFSYSKLKLWVLLLIYNR